MRQTHRAGEKLFVDYAGMRAQVINPATGAVREANIFVAVLGASNYTYAEATKDDKQEHAGAVRPAGRENRGD